MNNSWDIQSASGLEPQTTQMAEGQEPGQTLAKGEFATSSALDEYKEKMSPEHLASSSYCMYCQM